MTSAKFKAIGHEYDFNETFDDVLKGCTALFNHIENKKQAF